MGRLVVNVETLEKVNGMTLNEIAGKVKDKSINRVIDMNIEEMKRERYLTPMIRELDIQELKKLDAVLHRGEIKPSITSISSVDLSERAVNLYVAIVKGVFTKTVDTCCELYTSEELVNLAKTSKTFNDELLLGNGDKNKKFEAAQKALIALRTSSPTKEIQPEGKLLAK